MIIFAAKHFNTTMFEESERRDCRIPKGVLFGKSKNGWTDMSMAMAWLRKHFGPGTTTERKADGEYRLLLFDGHNSHVNAEFLSYCITHKVIPFCLPPHTSQKSQPLDVAVFGPYKTYYRQELRQQFEKKRVVSKQTFWTILKPARDAAFTEANILSGFRKTGLVPINPDEVLDEIKKQHEIRITNRNRMLPQPNTTVPGPYSNPPHVTLHGIDIAEVNEMVPPRTPRSLKRKFDTLLEDLKGNTPRTYRHRKFAELIGEAAGVTMALRAMDHEVISNLREEIKQLKQRKKPRKKRIPVEGRAWIEVSEVVEFFKGDCNERRSHWPDFSHQRYSFRQRMVSL
jgi:hypothetical protein